MKLARLHVGHYRSCVETTFLPHPQLSVLIGPNGSGKTSLLHAILLLRSLIGHRGRQREPNDATTTTLQAKFVSKTAKADLNAKLSIGGGEPNVDSLTPNKIKWLITSGRKRPVTIEGDIGLPYGATGRRQDVLRWQLVGGKPYSVQEFAPQWALTEFEAIAKFCDGMRYYSASQFTNPGAYPVSFEVLGDEEDRGSWRLNDQPRMRTLYQMFKAYKGRETNNYMQFIDMVGKKGLRLVDDITFREVKLAVYDATVRLGGRLTKTTKKKVLVIPQFRRGRLRLSPNQLSEGTLRTLALLFYVITEESTALLIEEPEVCVHHGLLTSIIELIKQESRNKQMILSTHSDHVLDMVQPENVFITHYSKSKGTQVESISRHMGDQKLQSLRQYLRRDGNLGDYWRETGFGVE